MRTPTEKQKAALRKFRVPEAEIETMSFEKAMARLDSLIKGIKKPNADPIISPIPGSKTSPMSASKIAAKPASPAEESRSSSQEARLDASQIVANRLKTAKRIVDEQWPEAKDYAEYVNLVTETMHQLGAMAMAEKVQAYKERNLGSLNHKYG